MFFYKVFFLGQNQYWFLIFISFVNLIFSLSRSAIFSLIAVLGFLLAKAKKHHKQIYLIIIFLITSFFLLTGKSNYFLPKKVIKFLNISKEKSFLAKRDDYFLSTLKILAEKPFGIGFENQYFYTIKNQFNLEEAITTSHNLFIDIFVETGIGGGLAFIVFLYLIFKKSLKNEFFYLFLGLNLVFFFDFFYIFPFFLINYFLLAGLIYQEDKEIYEIKTSNLFLPQFLIIVFYFVLTLSQFFFQNKQYQKAIAFFPYNWRYYYPLIIELIDRKDKKVLDYLGLFEKNFPNGHIFNQQKARFYEKLNQNEKAIYYYQKFFYEAPISFEKNRNNYMDLLFSLYGDVQGRKLAEEFIRKWRREAKISENSFLNQVIINHCRDYRLKY
ncbi:MAG: O-antigen ligase family protein [Microgenomates group bacterium]